MAANLNPRPETKPRQTSPFALAAIALGFPALLTLFLWTLAGPASSGGSGSGRIYANGVMEMTASRPVLSFAEFVLLAFLLCLAALLLSLVSFWRREQLRLSFAALLYGLSPVFIYLLWGPLLGSLPALACTLVLASLALYRRS